MASFHVLVCLFATWPCCLALTTLRASQPLAKANHSQPLAKVNHRQPLVKVNQETDPEPSQWTAWLMFETNGTDGYKDIFQCWTRHYMRHPNARARAGLRIGCLSDAACGIANDWSNSDEVARRPKLNISVQQVRDDPVLSARPDYFYRRVYFDQIRQIMDETQKGVLHTDLDAFWVGNIEEVLAQVEDYYPTADMIYSVGNTMPWAVVRDWGFSLCNGFALYRHTPLMQEFLRTVSYAYEHDEKLNDQGFINKVVWGKGCFWYEEQKVITSGAEVQLQTISVGLCAELKIVVLPESMVGRGTARPANDTRMVVHPYVRDEWKLELLRNMSLCH